LRGQTDSHEDATLFGSRSLAHRVGARE